MGHARTADEARKTKQYLEVKPQNQGLRAKPIMTYQPYTERLGQDCDKSLMEMKVMYMDRNRWRPWTEAPYNVTLRCRGADKEEKLS